LLGWQGYHLVEHAQVFSVRKITVQGCSMASEEQVVALSGIKVGMSMLGFTAKEAARRIRTHPWIDHARIHRSWPYSVQIEVREHRPLAMINLENEQGLYYLDHNGKVFAPVEPGQDLDFPVVTGLRLQHPPANMQDAGKEAVEAIRFLHFAALGNPVLPMQSISEIHLSRENGIIAYLAERPFPIHLGYGNIRTRYYQLVRLLEQLYSKEKIEHIKEIRMDYQADRILVSKTEP
jgi:cell division protein FtsQ